MKSQHVLDCLYKIRWSKWPCNDKFRKRVWIESVFATFSLMPLTPILILIRISINSQRSCIRFRSSYAVPTSQLSEVAVVKEDFSVSKHFGFKRRDSVIWSGTTWWTHLGEKMGRGVVLAGCLIVAMLACLGGAAATQYVVGGS